MNKIKNVLKKFDNKKDDLKSEYEKFKSKFEDKKIELSKEYEELKNKYELKKEQFTKDYLNFKEKYEFKIEGKKIIWNKQRILEQKKYKKSVFDSIFSATIREIISFPFIWMMLLPAFILDIFLFIYQNTAIRLYKIPLAKRSDYIVFDRGQLAYLNWIQKIDCIYCSYFNGLMQYSVEVAGRTEKYWCPIKHATKIKGSHDWEEYFAEYGDSKGFKEVFGNIDDYKKSKNHS